MDSAAMERFLFPKLCSISDPELLPDMVLAVERINVAIHNRERIVLYGDYDVDGISSLALISRTLAMSRIETKCFLPQRADEGYGLSLAGIDRCFREYQPELLIVMDCGTNSVEEVTEIQSRGADVIILDHHEVHSERPDCVAVVNPKRGKDFHYLCSTGIVFKLAHALMKYRIVPKTALKEYLDLVALATVSDLVPLVGENRVLVKCGLEQMERTRWAGLAALMQISGIRAPVRSVDIGFRLGPRINAAGRLGSAKQALALLLSDDPRECVALARNLDTKNCKRQAIEQSVVQAVELWIAENHDHTRRITIVAGHQSWHHGVLGIVASRIAQRYYRPTFIVGFDPSGIGKGSGRSIKGFSLIEALRRCTDALEKFGGHQMAAGLTLWEPQFKNFCASFEYAAQTLITKDMLIPRLFIDAEVCTESLLHPLLECQDRLEPFGVSNPQPLFLFRRLQPANLYWIKKRHLRMQFVFGHQRLQAIFFNASGLSIPYPPWDIAFHLDRNDFRGSASLQLRIIDFRSSDECFRGNFSKLRVMK